LPSSPEPATSASGPAAAWDEEYRRAGIPSSHRDDPSGAVSWALRNWPQLGAGPLPRRALDVGCGTGRNAVHLASRGIDVIAFDSAPAAIAAARSRARTAGLELDLRLHDLHAGLPAADRTVDLVLDVFVYKHQTDPAARRRYRQELGRVLADEGRVLISVAEPGDGYYGACPPAPEPEAAPHAVIDPALGLGSVLFSLAELEEEMADTLSLEMAWRKAGVGEMHGQSYLRRTLATLWRRPAQG
jgi:SAM-dependent methyltransferase